MVVGDSVGAENEVGVGLALTTVNTGLVSVSLFC